MIPKIRIRAEAEADIEEAFSWYEARIDGLGNEFIEEVDASLKRIGENPLSYAIVHKRVLRALLRRFPYGIFYHLEGDEIVVISCFHCSRDPRVWRRRA